MEYAFKYKQDKIYFFKPLNCKSHLFKNSISSSQEAQWVPIQKINQLVLFREEITSNVADVHQHFLHCHWYLQTKLYASEATCFHPREASPATTQ
jgi:hypothetical protein